MTYATIDSIVNSALLSNNLTIHYYVQLLNEALKCLNEISYDTLPTPKSVELTVNAFNEVTIPEDYIDWARVGEKYGLQILPLLPNPNYNRLAATNDLDEQIAYTEPITYRDSISYFGDGYWWNNYTSSYGEHTGRFYGHGGGKQAGFFKPIEERGVIQLDTSITPGTTIYLEYIAFDTATIGSLVPKYAESTIESYITWQYKSWSTLYNLGDVDRAERTFHNNHRKLRARMSDLTIDVIRNTARKHFKQSVKL